MRRKDREVTNGAIIDEIISECYCCRLGLNDNGRAYIVPLNFGFKSDENGRVFYFHSAKSGRKLELIQRNGRASFELDTGYKLKPGDTPCSCSAMFKSVMGEGSVFIVEDKDEKSCGLNSILKTAAGKEGCKFSDEMLNSVCVFKLEVENISCKVHE